MGYCMLDFEGKPIGHGVYQLADKSGAAIDDRILTAHNILCDLLDEYMPDVVAIEAPFAVRSTSAIPLAQVNGVLKLTAKLRGIQSVNVPPMSAKKRLTGKGNANKTEMIEAAKPIIGDVSEHTADALAIALTVQG